MRLTDIFTGNQLHRENTVQSGRTSNVAQRPDTPLVSRQIEALKPGQTLSGEVVGKDGNVVQIKVSDDFILEAKMDQNMNIEVGKNMTFEVRNNGRTLTLSPLFTNTATQENALKALNMAALPVNGDTVTMTGLMMQAGLSIDKNSLQQMFKEMNLFPNSAVSDLVDLHKLGLAVNEENLTQVASYKNLTHQLVSGMREVLDALPESMQSMAEEGYVQGAQNLFRDLLDMISGIPEEEPPEAASQNVAAGEGQTGEEVLQAAGGEVQAEQMRLAPEDALRLLENLLREETAEAVVGQEAEDAPAAVLQDGDAWEASQTGALERDAALPEQTAENPENSATSLAGEVIQLLREGGEAPETYKAALLKIVQGEGNLSVAQQADGLKELMGKLAQSGAHELTGKLIHHSGVEKFLKEGMSKLWTIEPRDVSEPSKIGELYERLTHQLKSISTALEQNGQENSAAFKAASNMSQNIDFLNQINQAYTYVQLPLRLQQGDTHGDLYVYTNKRNLAAKDGPITALLHLDMEYLGPVDVYVSMQSEKVNTQFYVEDDEILDFLEAHMDLLTERLKKRGYDISCNTKVKNSGAEPESGLHGLLGAENPVKISQYAFDMRA